jgi:hypothetical protein
MACRTRHSAVAVHATACRTRHSAVAVHARALLNAMKRVCVCRCGVPVLEQQAQRILEML